MERLQQLIIAIRGRARLFTDLPLSTFSDSDQRSSFAVYIKDDEDAYVERRAHSC
jgi:hypothetical protein